MRSCRTSSASRMKRWKAIVWGKGGENVCYMIEKSVYGLLSRTSDFSFGFTSRGRIREWVQKVDRYEIFYVH